MEEIWKDIDENYQVSNLGRVKSLRYGKERILKPIKNTYGYLQVCLNSKKYSVHRLVAKYFIPNPNNLQEINHKDENPQNNVYSNLEWCDRKYNCNYGTYKERVSTTQLNDANKSKQVNQYSKDGKTLIKTFPSTMQVQREYGYSNQHISDCCNGKLKSAYGFRWEYV